MKFKPVTIYLGAFALVVLLIFLFSEGENNEVKKPFNSHEGVPMDNPHEGMKDAKGEIPSKDNVSESYKKKVEELRIRIKENPNDTLSIKELGHFQYMAHKTDEALDLYNRILAIDPHRTDILFAVGVIHYNEGKYDEAESFVKKVLEYDPANSVAIYNLGAIKKASGDNVAALKYWKRVINEHPKTQEAFLAQTAIRKMEDENK